MLSKVSLQAKLLLLFCTSLAVVFAAMNIMHLRDLKLLDMEVAKALRTSNTIALNGVLLEQHSRIDKILTNLLNTDELNQFSTDPSNKTAEITVRGMMLSLEAVLFHVRGHGD